MKDPFALDPLDGVHGGVNVEVRRVGVVDLVAGAVALDEVGGVLFVVAQVAPDMLATSFCQATRFDTNTISFVAWGTQ